METVTARGTGASGLATPAARWALIAAWGCGAIAGLINGSLTPPTIGVAAAYVLTFVGLVLLTDRNDAPLGTPRALALAVIALASTVLGFPPAPPVGEAWLVLFSGYLLALMAARGNFAIGLSGGAVQVALIVALGVTAGWSATTVAGMLIVPVGSYALSVIWRIILRALVRRERAHRSAAAESVRQAEAAELATARYQADLEAVRERVLPLLEALRDGATLTPEALGELSAAEGALRDEIRAPAFRHPVLTGSVARARQRGIDVTLLAPLSAPPVDDSAAQTLAAMLDDTTEERVVISIASDNPTTAISFVKPASDYTAIVARG